ncbi:hypothetical protein PENSTE_c003G00398 [Penicillium steckii]|uniref:Uncharacterized protein n=1 Tax=Penicillium steckii TaxID=303698 RepID=A0A1V6TPL9_9EURO|nr:hypothetical protein PENSTE_c003G00398 [Penicillium steckii]
MLQAEQCMADLAPVSYTNGITNLSKLKMATTWFGDCNQGLQIGANSGTVNFHPSPPADKPVDTCRRRLLLTDPGVDRDTVKSVKGERATGTCEWIRENETYISWLKGDLPCIWISGGPGQGKTMLSLFLIEELEEGAQESDDLVLSYICNHQDEKRNSAVAIMRSFIYQILTKRPNLFDHVRSSFESQEKTALVLGSFQTLWKIFTVLLGFYAYPVSCVLDGLDECDDESVRQLTRNLTDYFSSETTKSSNFNLVIVSRFLAGLNTFVQVRLDPDNNAHTNSDIQKFVSRKLEGLEIAVPGFRKIKRKVGETLLERAEGTFLWVGFVTDQLSQKTTCTQISDALDTMSKGLPAIYSRILSKTEKNRRPILSKMLRWVTIATRPLSVKELAAALAIDHTEHLSCEQIVLDYISMCGNMLQVNMDEVRFVHQSVMDYLLKGNWKNELVPEDFHINEQSAHSGIAAVCVDLVGGSILKDKPLKDYEIQQYSKIHPLFEYAIKNWFKHAKAGSGKLKSDLVLDRPFFKRLSKTRDNWLLTCLDLPCKLDGIVFICSDSPLHLASCLGIDSWVEKELRNGLRKVMRLYKPISRTCQWTGTPIMCAVRNEHQATVKLLVENGVVTNGHIAPLSRAVGMRNQAIVTFLLERCSYAENDLIEVLELAALNIDPTITKMLLDYDARISLAGNITRINKSSNQSLIFHSRISRKLKVAMDCGHSVVIRKLLEDIQDVNFELRETFLMRAAKAGDIASIEYLLARGANVNQKTRSWETALSAVCSSATNMPVIRILLENGADVKKDPMALQRATKCTDRRIIRILLEHGADPYATGPNGENALDMAIQGGRKDVERIFREFSTSRLHGGRTM